MQRTNFSRLISVEKAIRDSWSKETSYWPDSYENSHPSSGQCAVTALLVHNLFGGQLKRGWAINKEAKVRCRHYWNEINEIGIDLTWEQFPDGTILDEVKNIEPKKLLANKQTKQRFRILQNNYRLLSC